MRLLLVVCALLDLVGRGAFVAGDVFFFFCFRWKRIDQYNKNGNDDADSEMAGRHRCRPRSIQIIRTGIVAAKDTKRTDVQQFHVSFLLLSQREANCVDSALRRSSQCFFGALFFVADRGFCYDAVVSFVSCVRHRYKSCVFYHDLTSISPLTGVFFVRVRFYGSVSMPRLPV